jgi:hypothetical protein
MQAHDNVNWMPIESNPEVMNPFALKLGKNKLNSHYRNKHQEFLFLRFTWLRRMGF